MLWMGYSDFLSSIFLPLMLKYLQEHLPSNISNLSFLISFLRKELSGNLNAFIHFNEAGAFSEQGLKGVKIDSCGISKYSKGGIHMTNATVTNVKRTYKSRLFEMIFSDKEKLLELYNAVNGTHYEDTEGLEVNTLENAIYLSMHNDVSFLIESRLNLYEHQSTYSPNLPLRFLMYISDLYSVITKDANLYGKKPVKIPTPEFVIFYNGMEEQPDTQVLKLSDMYAVTGKKTALELTAMMLNINPGHNPRLMEASRTLWEYSQYVERVRINARTMALEEAVSIAITECIRDNILADFLSKNRAEAMSVSIYEYDEEKHMRQEREDSYQDGVKDGIKASVKITQDLGASKEKSIEVLMQRFGLKQTEAAGYVAEYWEEAE